MKTNFTLSHPWIDSLKVRYDLDSLIFINEELAFYKKDNTLKCQSFFNFDLKDSDLEKIAKLIDNGFTFDYKYIDNDSLFQTLNEFAERNKYKLKINDEWDAPILNVKNIEEYLKNNKCTQVVRNYKKYIKNKDLYKFELSNKSNVFKLWTDVLDIDYNSWKKHDKSDMKSLDREDLQYVFYLIENDENASLLVMYDNDMPCGYSLMFRSDKNSEWYQVKWGASEYGRTIYAGIYTLFHHMMELNKNESQLKIDFWGRRSRVYDYLKTDEKKRMHIELGK